ncbi:uncharacterized protein LOC119609056 isoform X1 [Lucilia sericata]|uniref:uncharacterized protein LOC119609056 isoform X1 n=1 Tax=Lucilia sericata TaxID=13632 RepID=UPI0018A8138B|nr:uncharacterized protein LOC119609056 isoform X1 [Lucilia sericata]
MRRLTPETRGLILNSQAKKAVKNALQQMPCGWPEYGIPPLAPYTNPDLEVHLAKSVVDALVQMIRFRFDGLDKMEIKKLKVSYTFNKKVKFHFNFPVLKATASLMNTDTFLDTMKQLGLSVRYEGSGPFEFSLQNLSIEGQFKYKMPFIFGSIKIYKFQAVVTLGSVTSNIGGILGNGKLNKLVNDQIEDLVPSFINGHQAEISAMIEENFVPRVNAMMKGKKIWYMLGQLGGSTSKCDAPPAPWSNEI